MMDTTARRAGLHPQSDPDFQATDVGPAKDGIRSGRSRRRQMRLLGVLLAIVWLAVLLDPNIGGLVLQALGAFGAALGVVAAAMGLGLLGFVLCAAGDRFVGWLRHGTRWPEE